MREEPLYAESGRREIKSGEMPIRGVLGVKAPPSVSGETLRPPEGPGTSLTLSKDLSLRLLSLIEEVTKREVTPATVNSACKCAAEINKLLRLGMELRRQ